MLKQAGSAVRAVGLTRHFGSVVAVDGVDLEVGQKEIFALVGPDGAGKTTLIRLLCGVLTPDGGTAQVLGQDVIQSPEAVKKRIGYMPQRFSLYGELNVLENLALYAGLYGVPSVQFRDRAAVLLADFSLSDAAQRLAQHLYRLNRTGIAIFVSTPYLDEAEYASRVGLIDHGRLVACDDPAALKATMDGELLEVIAEPRAAARSALRDLSIIRSLEIFGDRLHALVPSAQAAVPQIQQALDARGARVLGIRRISPSLEDVFVSRITAAPGT